MKGLPFGQGVWCYMILEFFFCFRVKVRLPCSLARVLIASLHFNVAVPVDVAILIHITWP